jgi:hypothetical protein
LAKDFGKVDAGFFEDAALDEDARASAAPPVALPAIFLKALAVKRFKAGTDAILKAAKVADRLRVLLVKLGHWRKLSNSGRPFRANLHRLGQV